jgi:hypothetical protein
LVTRGVDYALKDHPLKRRRRSLIPSRVAMRSPATTGRRVRRTLRARMKHAVGIDVTVTEPPLGGFEIPFDAPPAEG